MADNQLVILSKAFAVDIIRLCENLRERKKATAIIHQLLRSGTSIGADIHEANYASGKADFALLQYQNRDLPIAIGGTA